MIIPLTPTIKPQWLNSSSVGGIAALDSLYPSHNLLNNRHHDSAWCAALPSTSRLGTR